MAESKAYPNGNNPLSPNHYAHWTIQPLEFIAKNGLDFLRGNVIKYVMRHNMKDGVQDLSKAFVYLLKIVRTQYSAKEFNDFITSVEEAIASETK